MVQLCAGAGGGAGASAAAGSSLAEQLSVQCTDGTAAEDCIPECNAVRHGFILLLNLDGDDTKLSCNLAHGLYSWISAASLGGYIGADSASFFSAVVSGAAGTYMGTLTADAGISTDLTIQPGHDVHISGVGRNWGTGGFTVSDQAALSITDLMIPGYVAAGEGGELILRAVMVSGTLADSYSMATDGVVATTLTVRDYASHAQCLAPYSVLFGVGAVSVPGLTTVTTRMNMPSVWCKR